MEDFQNIPLLHEKSLGLSRGCITRVPDCIENAESGAHLHCVTKSLYNVLHAWSLYLMIDSPFAPKNLQSNRAECRGLFTWSEEDP